MSKRTDKVEITPQGKVLRYLREKHEFSMREAGERMGYSSSYISQIENGRENPPKGVRLQKFLKVYGGISEKYFYQLCREWREESSDLDIVSELLPKLKPDKLRLVRAMVEQLAKEGH